MANPVVTLPEGFNEKLQAANAAIDSKLSLLSAPQQFLLNLKAIINAEEEKRRQLESDFEKNFLSLKKELVVLLEYLKPEGQIVATYYLNKSLEWMLKNKNKIDNPEYSTKECLITACPRKFVIAKLLEKEKKEVAEGKVTKDVKRKSKLQTLFDQYKYVEVLGRFKEEEESFLLECIDHFYDKETWKFKVKNPMYKGFVLSGYSDLVSIQASFYGGLGRIAADNVKELEVLCKTVKLEELTNCESVLGAFDKIGKFNQTRYMSKSGETSLDKMVQKHVDALTGSTGLVGRLRVVFNSKQETKKALDATQPALEKAKNLRREVISDIANKDKQLLALLQKQVNKAFNNRTQLVGVGQNSKERRYHRARGQRFACVFTDSIDKAESFSKACALLKAYLNDGNVKFRDHSFASYLLIELFENSTGVFAMQYGEQFMKDQLEKNQLKVNEGLAGLGLDQECGVGELEKKRQFVLNPELNVQQPQDQNSSGEDTASNGNSNQQVAPQPDTVSNSSSVFKDVVDAYRSEKTFCTSRFLFFNSSSNARQCVAGGVREELRAQASNRFSVMADKFDLKKSSQGEQQPTVVCSG